MSLACQRLYLWPNLPYCGWFRDRNRTTEEALEGYEPRCKYQQMESSVPHVFLRGWKLQLRVASYLGTVGSWTRRACQGSKWLRRCTLIPFGPFVPSIYLSVYLSIYLFIYVASWLSTHPSVYPSVYLPSIYPSLYPPLSVSLPMYLFVYLSMYLSLCLSIFAFILRAFISAQPMLFKLLCLQLNSFIGTKKDKYCYYRVGPQTYIPTTTKRRHTATP